MVSNWFHGSSLRIHKVYPLQILKNGSSAVRLLLNPAFLNLRPDQMVGHSWPLVGGQGEVGQVDGGTLRGPGPDQASPDLKQHRHKCCPSHNTGSVGDSSVRLRDQKSQRGSEHLHPHQHPHHGPYDGFCGSKRNSPSVLDGQAGYPSTLWPNWSWWRDSSSSTGCSRCWFPIWRQTRILTKRHSRTMRVTELDMRRIS